MRCDGKVPGRVIDCHFFFGMTKIRVLNNCAGKNAFDKRNAQGLPAEFLQSARQLKTE